MRLCRLVVAFVFAAVLLVVRVSHGQGSPFAPGPRTANTANPKPKPAAARRTPEEEAAIAAITASFYETVVKRGSRFYSRNKENDLGVHRDAWFVEEYALPRGMEEFAPTVTNVDKTTDENGSGFEITIDPHLYVHHREMKEGLPLLYPWTEFDKCREIAYTLFKPSAKLRAKGGKEYVHFVPFSGAKPKEIDLLRFTGGDQTPSLSPFGRAALKEAKKAFGILFQRNGDSYFNSIHAAADAGKERNAVRLFEIAEFGGVPSTQIWVEELKQSDSDRANGIVTANCKVGICGLVRECKFVGGTTEFDFKKATSAEWTKWSERQTLIFNWTYTASKTSTALVLDEIPWEDFIVSQVKPVTLVISKNAIPPPNKNGGWTYGYSDLELLKETLKETKYDESQKLSAKKPTK